MKYKKMPHCCRNNSKSNMKIIERGKIDTPNTQIQYHSFSWLGTGTSVKNGIVKLVSWAQATLLSEMMQS